MQLSIKHRRFKILLAASATLMVGVLLPESPVVPVERASTHDWNAKAFWYEPWGASGVHKGIDIFAPKGRSVVAPTYGIVIYRGTTGIGGNVVAMLGPKWRIHYFAHLDSSSVGALSIVRTGRKLGTIGTSGNAAGKQPHLHYAIWSALPMPWQATRQTQGWKKMFFVDPGKWLIDAQKPAPEGKVGWQQYTNEKYGYSLRYPLGFEVFATGASGVRDGRTLRIGRRDYSAPAPILDLDLSALSSGHRAWIESRHPAYSVKSQPTKINGLAGTLREIRHEPGGELAWVIVDLGRANMILSVSTELQDYRSSEWWQIVSSFSMTRQARSRQ
jgi:peptidoglycan LD-endopeptidase LytH